jgi:asparagine synthase (glutamine-hydrolysing)
MCGIFGQLERRLDPGVCERFVPAALRALDHRGPDGKGFIIDDQCLLGHTRLAIIDLSESGAQPRRSSSGASLMTFNGELYNFVELKKALVTPTGGWKSTSDTEVLLEALEQHGIPALARMNGMFAFAWWRPRERELVLVRDRFGKKPLYWLRTSSGGIRFASEIGALFSDGAAARTSADRIAEFLQYGYNLAPRTSFEGVESVAPGHLLRAKLGDDGTLDVRIERYWELPPYAPDPEDGFGSWVEEVGATLKDAVAIRMRADVPVGAFLSGGVDSSIVSLLASRATGGPLRTVTTDFPEKAFSESAYAEEVARHIGAHHRRLLIEPPSPDDVDDLVGIYGDLMGDISALLAIAVSRAAREHVKVALTGDGGDESMAGYVRYFQSLDASARAGALPSSLRRAASAAGEHFPVWLRGDSRVALFGADLPRAFASTVRQFPSRSTVPLMRGPLSQPVEPVLAALERHSDRPPLLRMMAADAETYIPGDTNPCLDRASMSVGLELRCPFLDHRLYELVSRARPEWLVDDRGAKRALRHLYASELPPAVFTRSKMGFQVPIMPWFRGESLAKMTDRILDRGSRLYDVLDRRAVEKMVHGFRLRLHRSAGRIWLLLVLDAWLSRWRPTLTN